MRFDAKSFLTQEFGNAQSVLALFRFYGIGPVKSSTVEKWFQRGSIPGEHLPSMLCVLELERGEPVRLARFLKEAGSGSETL